MSYDVLKSRLWPFTVVAVIPITECLVLTMASDRRSYFCIFGLLLLWMDCGEVTTGPVTVLILLLLGIGIMKGQRARQETREALQEKFGKNQCDASASVSARSPLPSRSSQ